MIEIEKIVGKVKCCICNSKTNLKFTESGKVFYMCKDDFYNSFGDLMQNILESFEEKICIEAREYKSKEVNLDFKSYFPHKEIEK